MTRRLAVSDGNTVRDVVDYKVAVDGKVKDIIAAAVVDKGIVRKYWKPWTDPTAPEQRIVWDTTEIYVRDHAYYNLTVVSKIGFTRSNGVYTYDSHPEHPKFAQFIAPPLDGTPDDNGKFLIRAKQVSGTALTGVMDTWIDLNVAATVQWSLDHTGIGDTTAIATIEIGQDSGDGTPITYTIIKKTINFYAEVTGLSGIAWSSLRRDLVEIKEAVNADCELVFAPTGFANGKADTSGAFTEAWAAGPSWDAADFTVHLQKISGDTLTGSPVGVDLPLHVAQSWKLEAAAGEDKSCEMHVSVAMTGGAVASKIVSMHSKYDPVDPPIPPVWEGDEWNLSDVGHGQVLASNVFAHAIFQTDGTAIGRIDNSNYDAIQETDTWLPVGENNADYEVMIQSVAGSTLITSHTYGVWYSLANEQHILFEGITLPKIKHFSYTLSIRKVGSLAAVRAYVVTVTGAIDDGTDPL